MCFWVNPEPGIPSLVGLRLAVKEKKLHKPCISAVLAVLGVSIALTGHANLLCSTPQAYMAPARPGAPQPLNQCELAMYGASGPAVGNRACISNVQIRSGLTYQQGAAISFAVSGQNLGSFRFSRWNVDLRPAGDGAQYIGRNLYEGSGGEVSTNIPQGQTPGTYYLRVNAVIEHCNGKREILYKDEGPIRVVAAAAATPAPVVAPAMQQPLASMPGRSVKLYSAHAPGKCIAPAAGGGLVLWDCVDNPNQLFDWLPEGQLRQNGRCLGHSGEITRFEECTRNATHQQWSNDGGLVRNRNVPGQCLDIERGAADNGTRILAYACHGGGNQRWSTTPVAQSRPAVTAPVPVSPAPQPANPATPGQPAAGADIADPAGLPTTGLLQGTDAPAEITGGARELEKFNVLAQNLAGLAANSGIPELQNAAAFLALSATLGQTISNPREWLAQSGIDDPWIIEAATLALQNHLNAPEVLEALRRFNREAVRLAWQIDPALVSVDTPWRDRTLAQLDAALYLPGPQLNQRIDHSRMGTVQGLLWTMEVNSMLVGNARTVLDFVVNYDNIVSKLMDVLFSHPRLTKFIESVEKDVGGMSSVAERTANLESVKRNLPSIIKFVGDLAAPVAVAMVVAETAKTALDGAAAFLPNKFTDFYVTIAGQRHYPGQGSPMIAVGQRTPLLVYATYETAGGEIDTPWGLLEKVAERFLKAPRVAGFLQKAGAKVNARAVDLAKQVEQKLAERGHPLLMQKMRNAAQRASQAHGSRIKAQIDDWVEKVKSYKYQVKPSKREVNITGDNVTLIQTRSANLLDAGTDGKHSHFLTGKSAGKAGYRVAVVQPLLQRINNLPQRMPGGRIMDAVGEVIVQGAVAPVTAPLPGGPRRCGPDNNAYCEGNVCMDMMFGREWPEHRHQCR